MVLKLGSKYTNKRQFRRHFRKITINPSMNQKTVTIIICALQLFSCNIKILLEYNLGVLFICYAVMSINNNTKATFKSSTFLVFSSKRFQFIN
jgi:hypothetical protein